MEEKRGINDLFHSWGTGIPRMQFSMVVHPASVGDHGQLSQTVRIPLRFQPYEILGKGHLQCPAEYVLCSSFLQKRAQDFYVTSQMQDHPAPVEGEDP